MRALAEAGEPSEIQRLRDDLVRVPVRTPTLPPATYTNLWLVDTADGWLVVDPASGAEASIAALDRAIRLHAGGWGNVRGALITHHHRDHVGGVPWWVQHSGLPLLGHAQAAALVDRWPASGQVVEDGARLGEVTAEATPGHASDHLALHLPLGGVIAGDVVTGLGTVVINPPDGDLTDYLNTLERWLHDAPGTLFPSHGWEITEAEAHLAALLRHRHARLDALRAALDDGTVRPLAALVQSAWADVPRALHPLAARTACAHLAHLERLGEVARTRDGWQIASG